MERDNREELKEYEGVKDLLLKSPFAKAANYPKPDRSSFTPNFKKTKENYVLDIGYNEGILSDGRPYRVEAWCTDQTTMLTYYFSSKAIEGADDEYFVKMLQNEGLLRIINKHNDKYPLESEKFDDASKNSMWSINVLVATEYGEFVEDLVKLKQYPR